jgi:hypothetical protein
MPSRRKRLLASSPLNDDCWQPRRLHGGVDVPGVTRLGLGGGHERIEGQDVASDCADLPPARKMTAATLSATAAVSGRLVVLDATRTSCDLDV